ncbi:MAG TPA: NAD(P)/FAD-dependent oxidoreductase [Anaerolineae bacterium]|nr:NAD(P)/FAD-dependent oxidoreductase [Anaerolineae bacterium]
MTDDRILVIGSGPAGSSLALRMVQLGAEPESIVVLDRRRLADGRLSPAKVCGDGISPACLAMLGSLGIPGHRFDEFQPIDGLRITSPGGVVLDVPNIPGPVGRIIPRDALDGMMADQVRQVGVCLLDGREVNRIERANGEWIVSLADGEDLRGALLVGADGATSKVARLINSPQESKRHPRSVMIAIRGYGERIELGGQLWMDFLSGMPGYAWAFPLTGGKANVGVGTTAAHLRRSAQKRGQSSNAVLKSMLERSCEQFILAGAARAMELQEVRAWPIPTGPKFRRCVDEGVVLVGDATGGAASPLTGGGIANSIVSATLAANVIAAARQQGSFSSENLEPYQRMLRKELSPKMRDQLYLERILENEAVFNMVAKILSCRPELVPRIWGG